MGRLALFFVVFFFGLADAAARSPKHCDADETKIGTVWASVEKSTSRGFRFEIELTVLKAFGAEIRSGVFGYNPCYDLSDEFTGGIAVGEKYLLDVYAKPSGARSIRPRRIARAEPEHATSARDLTAVNRLYANKIGLVVRDILAGCPSPKSPRLRLVVYGNGEFDLFGRRRSRLEECHVRALFTSFRPPRFVGPPIKLDVDLNSYNAAISDARAKTLDAYTPDLTTYFFEVDIEFDEVSARRDAKIDFRPLCRLVGVDETLEFLKREGNPIDPTDDEARIGLLGCAMARRESVVRFAPLIEGRYDACDLVLTMSDSVDPSTAETGDLGPAVLSCSRSLGARWNWSLFLELYSKALVQRGGEANLKNAALSLHRAALINPKDAHLYAKLAQEIVPMASLAADLSRMQQTFAARNEGMKDATKAVTFHVAEHVATTARDVGAAIDDLGLKRESQVLSNPWVAALLAFFASLAIVVVALRVTSDRSE